MTPRLALASLAALGLVVVACRSTHPTATLPAVESTATATTGSPPNVMNKPEHRGTRAGLFAPDFDKFRSDWYGKHLRAMNEPSLWEASNDGSRESYRFTWLRTWGHPVAIRFDVKGGAATMRYVELDGAGGYEPGKILIDRTRTLPAAEWSVVLANLQNASFWSAPTEQKDAGQDGLQWIIEGVRGGDYHIVDRWTPSYDTDRRGLRPFQEACHAAFDAAKPTTSFE